MFPGNAEYRLLCYDQFKVQLTFKLMCVLLRVITVFRSSDFPLSIANLYSNCFLMKLIGNYTKQCLNRFSKCTFYKVTYWYYKTGVSTKYYLLRCWNRWLKFCGRQSLIIVCVNRFLWAGFGRQPINVS